MKYIVQNKIYTKCDSNGLNKTTYVTVAIQDDSLANKLKLAHQKYGTLYKGMMKAVLRLLEPYYRMR